MEGIIFQTRNKDKYRDDHGGDSDFSEDEDELTPVNQLELLNLKYNASLDWDQYADYSGFLAGIHEAQINVANERDSNSRFQLVSDFLKFSESN